MNIKITPHILEGELTLPSSKSISHRALICGALANGLTTISNLLYCADTKATILGLTALGAKIKQNGKIISIKGINDPLNNVIINCKESASTLRFLMPVVASLGISAEFHGEGKLPKRPITPYLLSLIKNGVKIEGEEMPYKVSGKLLPGLFEVSGDVSSQFISGLMFSLPILNGDSEIILTSPLQSKPYVDMTISCLKQFGINIISKESGYFIPGNQSIKPCSFFVEADISNAAFFLVSNVFESDVYLSNISKNSLQGDLIIYDIIESFKINKTINVDARQFPDIVPILTVLACFGKGTSVISGCKRLKIKECNRLEAIQTELNKLGAKINIKDDSLIIEGVESLNGGICNSWNDHRIAMSLAIASQKCTEPVIIENAECVIKSYPQFFDDFTELGGIAEIVE